jgi:hypothetical protein
MWISAGAKPAERRTNMASNLRVIDEEQTAPRGAQDALESYEQTFVERDVSRLVETRKGRHLNVDEVLARSLPKVTDKGRTSGQEKTF